MPSALTKAIVDRLAGDVALTALLSTYRGAPAIFTRIPVPVDAVMPMIIVGGPVVDRPKVPLAGGDAGRAIMRDVALWFPATGSVREVETASERVRALFLFGSLAVVGFTHASTSCTGPISIAADDDTYGRVISLWVRLTV